MRVAHVTDAYLPRLGGIEMQVYDLAVRQRERGHETTVLTPTPQATDGRTGDDPDWVVRLDPPVPWSGLKSYVAGLTIGGKLDRGGYDVVHVHASVISPFAMMAAHAAAHMHTPVVITVHSLWSNLGPLPDVCWGVIHHRTWPVVWSAVSRTAAKTVAETLGSGSAVAVLPNGIDPHAWLSPRRPAQPGVVTIASVMRLSRRKRPMPLLRMLRRLRDRVSASTDLRVIIIGDGPQRQHMDSFLDENSMAGWVSLRGRLDRAEIRDVFAGTDLYVAPAELESFGIAALEARAAGLPIVASRHGGVGEFISDGDEGFLAGSDDEMVHALTTLVHDTHTRERIAAHNRAVLPAVSWPAVLDRTELLYRAAVRRAAGPPRRLVQVSASRGSTSTGR